MAKNSGGTKLKSPTGKSDFEKLSESKNWFISAGMSRYKEQKNDKSYDMADFDGLSENEKTYVIAYLTNAYRVVNDSLRGIEPNKDGDLLASKVSSALRKMKSYQGETYRRIHLKQKAATNLLSEYKSNKGKVVEFKEFLSSGVNKTKIKSKFSGGTNEVSIDFIIKSKKGKDIRRYNDEEKEILFNKGSRFKIISITGSIVRLEEV